MSNVGRYAAPLGAHGNAWNAVSTGTNTNSNIVDTQSCPYVSAFGHVSGAATISLMLSADGVNWYAGTTVVLAGAADFMLNYQTGARYIALQSSAGVTATATIAAK